MDHTYSNVVGQDDLTRFDKSRNKKHKKRRQVGELNAKKGNSHQGDKKQVRNKNHRRDKVKAPKQL